jgi:hypothetical protein
MWDDRMDKAIRQGAVEIRKNEKEKNKRKTERKIEEKRKRKKKMEG